MLTLTNLRSSGLVCGLLLVVAVGCQQPQRQPVLATLPPPPFGGPADRDLTVAAATRQPRTGSRVRVESGWVPRRPSDRWRCIVIHHSATRTGNAAEFDRMHRAKGWDELGYHFVIGNGSGSGDGRVEVGPRWKKQKHGAHAKTPDNYYNEHGIGICLVGDFDQGHPSERQMESLARLVSFLQGYFGMDHRRRYGHGDVKSTDCPGGNFSFDELNRRLLHYAATPRRTAAARRR